MQRVGARVDREPTADEHGKGAAVRRRVVINVNVRVSFSRARYQQSSVWPKQLEPAIKIRRANSQVDVVALVGSECPHVKISKVNRSGRIGTVGQRAAF